MLGRVVQAFLRLAVLIGLQKCLPELTVSDGQPILVSDHPVGFKSFLELGDRVIVPTCRLVLETEVGIENAERAVILQRLQDIPRFQVEGPGALWPTGFGLKISQVDQGLADCAPVLLPTLELQHLAIAAFCLLVVAHHCADIPEIPQ